MTSYEFEVASKNAVITVLKQKYGTEANIKDLELVCFAHVLGYKKCLIWGIPMGDKYAEVTFNYLKDELYVDMYTKTSNTVFEGNEIDVVAHTQW